MPTIHHQEVQKSLRRHLFVGMTALLLIGGGLGVWAATAQLAGAVVSSGVLVVESSVKKVQHPTGGVVGEIFVREGDQVQAGQILVKLDATQTRANLAVVVDGIDELMARQARLDAERTGADTVDFPPELLARISEPLVQKAVSGERKLFELRAEARAGQKQQLRERISQMREEIKGLIEQAGAKQTEIGLVEKELEGVKSLWEKQLVQMTRLTELEREAARLEGEKGQLVASTAEAKGKIAETELQIIQVDQDMRSQDGQDMSDVRSKLSELTERKVAAVDQLSRIDIRAPQTGTVHEMSMHTIGGVISPGEPIMMIVPDTDALVVEAKVATNDIDKLHIDQPVTMRFSAFNQRTTPEINGHVTRIAADLTQDQRTGVSYYVIRIAINTGELSKLPGKLVPGMPVEVFMQTETRNVLSYFLKPLQDQAARTFKDV